jgi:AraC-like DNA-binding protein
MSPDSGNEPEFPVVAATNLVPPTPLIKRAAAGSKQSPCSRLPTRRPRSPARTTTHFAAGHDGEGHSDFFKVSDALSLRVINTTYRRNSWIHFEGAGFFKLRLLLNGTLLEKSGDLLVRAPDASLHIAAAGGRAGDYLAANEHARMVVLYGRPELLTHVIGLPQSEVPPPFDHLFMNGESAPRMEPVAGSSVMQTAQLIVESIHQIRPALRLTYLESLSMQILLQILREFDRSHASRRDLSSLRTRDLNRIYIARDYLNKNFASAPSIGELARRVGMNQTKLKGVFREVTGMTIYDYILRCRMERAAILLQTQEYSIAEVAYQVGYTYPANFTHAFKKFHGALPRALIPARRSQRIEHSSATLQPPTLPIRNDVASDPTRRTSPLTIE